MEQDAFPNWERGIDMTPLPHRKNVPLLLQAAPQLGDENSQASTDMPYPCRPGRENNTGGKRSGDAYGQHRHKLVRVPLGTALNMLIPGMRCMPDEPFRTVKHLHNHGPIRCHKTKHPIRGHEIMTPRTQPNSIKLNPNEVFGPGHENMTPTLDWTGSSRGHINMTPHGEGHAA